MDELKKENVAGQSGMEEHTQEQRPSTKYGRTAYQQQMQEASQSDMPLQQGNMEQKQNDWQPYQTYTPYEEVKPQIKQTIAYILMALVAVSGIVDFIYNALLSRVYSMGDTMEEIIDATFSFSQEPVMLVLSTVKDILLWAIIVCLVLDIIKLRKAGKKITGAILFAIFLRPAYFIWRAHLLGQKKVLPIIYAVVVYILKAAEWGVIVAASMEMVMRTMF